MKRFVTAILTATVATIAVSSALAASGSTTTVQTRQATVNGKQETILTTSKGMSLYYYDKDAADTSTCTGACAKLWPAYTLDSGQPSGPGNLLKGLAVFQGPNGRQVEYHGHPLYTYAKDQNPGDVKGVGVFPTWHVATADLTASGSPQSGTGGSGSSGYGSGSSGSGSSGSGSSGSGSSGSGGSGGYGY